jgi:hypothetical protein
MCQESLIHYLDNSLNDSKSNYQAIDTDQTNIFGGSSSKKGQAKIELEHKGKITVPKGDIETYIREGHFALENDQRVANTGKETSSYKYQLPETIRQHAELINTKLTEIRICDPAIGSGAFPVGLLHELVNAMLVLKPHFSDKYLTEKLVKLGFDTAKQEINESRYVYRLKRHIIQESIYGVDIDASAIDIARLRLWLSLVVDEDDLDPIETLPNLDYKIVCGNSLIGMPETAMRNLEVEKQLEELKEAFYNQTNETKKKVLRQEINTKIRELLDSAEQFAGYKIDFDFKLFFSEVWREKGGFDVVIGNPPYVDIKQLDRTFTKFLFNEYKTTQNRINLYSIFIEQGLRLNNNLGSLVFINPNSMLINSSYKLLRKEIINGLIQVIKLPDGIFKEAIVETIIIQIGKDCISDSIRGAYYKKDEAINFDKLIFSHFNRSIFKSDSDLRISIFTTPEQTILLDRISDRRKNLASFYEPCLGITPYDKYKGHSPETIKSRAFHASEKLDNSYVPLISGSNIRQFYIDVNNIKEYLKYGDWLGAPRQIKFFINPRVIVRQIVSGNPLRIYAGYTTEELYFTQIGFAIISKNPENHSTQVLCAYLNSDILNFFHKYKFLDIEKNTFQKILIENCKSFPIEESMFNQGNYLTTIVDFIREFKGKDSIESAFFKELNNALFYELFFQEELKSAGKEIFKHLGDLKPIKDAMSEEEKLAIIQSEFERLYDPNHPVRYAIETLDSIEEVRIIKEALK